MRLVKARDGDGEFVKSGPIKDGPGGSRTYGMWQAALWFPAGAAAATFLGIKAFLDGRAFGFAFIAAAVVLWLAAAWVIMRLRRR